MILLSATEIIAQRVFNTLYIYLDIVFLVGLCAMLVWKKKYLTLLFGLAGGILYFIVDYGIFQLALGTRSIKGGDMLAGLVWMSMSYGLTNFVWIWLWFSRDSRKFEWTAIICVWWFCAPMLAQTFGAGMPVVKIQRTTGAYHGAMALILLVGYVGAIIYNFIQKDAGKRLPLLWLAATGIAVQLGWEFSLLIGGIRSAEIGSVMQKLETLVVNSLLETNLGAVPLYCIYALVTSRITERLKKRGKVGFTERLAELNAVPLFRGRAAAVSVEPVTTIADRRAEPESGDASDKQLSGGGEK